MLLEDPACEHLGEGRHDVDGEEGEPEEGLAGGALHLGRPEDRVVANDHVESHRHVQVLDGRPEPFKRRIAEAATRPRRRVRREVDSSAAGLSGPNDFLHGAVLVDQGDVGHRHQSAGVVGAEVHDVAVVGPAVGRGESGVGHMPLPTDADRRVQEGDVDALLVHHLQPGCRVVAPGWAPVLVSEPAALAVEGLGRIQVDAPQAGQSVAHDLERATVDEQHLVAPLVDFDADRPIPQRRLEVREPGVARLEDVTIRIHAETSTVHLAPPFEM